MGNKLAEKDTFVINNLISLLMKKFLFFVLFLVNSSGFAQSVSLCSWNLKDLGKRKSVEEIRFIAQTVKNYDVIAIQEVVAGLGGAQAVARLADELNRTGNQWDYTISDPTSGTRYERERYAFIWKTKKLLKIGNAWLAQNYEVVISREPFLIRFKLGNSHFTLVNFHAVPKAKQPETEIKYFKFLPDLYPKDQLIFCGDFNISATHSVFNPLKALGYQASLTAQKTTLKQKSMGNNSLASAYDHIFYRKKAIEKIESGIIPFYQKFKTLKEARLISDHLPIYLIFKLAI